MLENGNFELGTWTRKTHTGQEFGEIFVPTGWTAFWKEGPPVPHDPSNTNGYGRPEMHVIETVPPFLDPPRIHSGSWAVKLFTFFRIHDAGIYQRVAVTPGQRLRVAGWAHAWSSNNDNPRVSDTDGDGVNNFTFTIGIDPTGATDPWGGTVVWGDGAHIYNIYAQIPAVEAIATAGFVTVFVRSQVLWPFKHCDAYIDDITLTVLEDPVPIGTVPYYNREKYVKRVLVPPQNCTKERWQEISGIAYDQRSTVSGSLDDALGHEPDQEVLALVYNLPPSVHPSYLEFRDTFYPGAEIEFVNAPPIPPIEYNYPVVETGTKLHPHGIGEPYDVLNRMMQQGHPLPYCKILAANPNEVLAVRNLKQLSPTTKFVCRLMRVPDSGINIEGPDFNSNPQDYMNALLPTMRAYPEVTYWELWNEQDPPEIAGHVKLAMFAKACAEIAHAEGIKLALLSYSMGVPEQDEWQAIYDTGLFQTMIDGGHILSLHAYGQTTDPMSLEFILLRHRWLYNHILIPNNCVVPYIMTEYSIDESSPGIGITDWSTENLMAEYKRYDAFLAEEYYCLGASVYKFGIGDHYRHDDIWIPFTDLLYSVRDRQNAIPIGNGAPPEVVIVDVRNQLATNPSSPWYPWKKRTYNELTHIIIHHSAGAASSDVATVKAIAVYHTSPTGKNRPGICYTYMIGADGTIWYVSDIENVVFSQGSVDYPGDENRWGVGICLLGCFINGQEPTTAQMASLEKLITHISGMVGKQLAVWGHKDVIQTQCPGDSWPFKTEWGNQPVPEPVNVLVGVHSAPVPGPTIPMDQLITKLKALDIKWYKYLDDGQSSNNTLIAALLEAEITPIARMFPWFFPGPMPDGLHNRVRDIIQRGVKYIEPWPEVNLPNEWSRDYPAGGWQNTAAMDQVGSWLISDIRKIVTAGGRVAFPAMAPTERNGTNQTLSSVKWATHLWNYLDTRYHSEIQGYLNTKKLWVAVHSAAFSRPFDFNPYREWGIDDMCLRSYEVWLNLVRTKFGVVPEIHSTEGGIYSPAHMVQLTWPEFDYTWETWGKKVWDMYEWLTHNGGLTSMCSWTFSDQGAPSWPDCGWYDDYGEPRSPVTYITGE